MYDTCRLESPQKNDVPFPVRLTKTMLAKAHRSRGGEQHINFYQPTNKSNRYRRSRQATGVYCLHLVFHTFIMASTGSHDIGIVLQEFA